MWLPLSLQTRLPQTLSWGALCWAYPAHQSESMLLLLANLATLATLATAPLNETLREAGARRGLMIGSQFDLKVLQTDARYKHMVRGRLLAPFPCE